jgi:hypothetical protein
MFQLIPVNSKTTARQFLQVAINLYKNDPQWIRPLDKDIEEVFDPNKNKAFRFGEIERWILTDNGRLIGRIAAFVNKKYKNKGDDIPVGGIGFFECINNRDAAVFLLDNAKNWLIQKGMEAMDGPINFGERDNWWGLLTKGFLPPLYRMNYNPPYYETLFESYGFRPFFNQICFAMKVKTPLSEKVLDRHKIFDDNPDFSSACIRKNQLEKFAADFVTVYNKAWAGHGGLKQMELKQAVLLFNKMKRAMDEKVVWFAYHKAAPIAIFINLPDLNYWFKELHGKFGLLQKLKFLWLQKFSPNKKFIGIVFGVVPEWQGKGIDSYIVGESAKVLQQPHIHYEDYEMQWIGDFNPKMINVAEGLGEVYRSRNLTTYRYLFNSSKEFKRHPVL